MPARSPIVFCGPSKAQVPLPFTSVALSWLPGCGWASGAGLFVGRFTGDEHPSGGEYCTHITYIRMSLYTIARRLCLSKSSSRSRLSVICAHLYSTEAAKDTVVDLADRIAALPPEEGLEQIAPALLFRLNQEPPQTISGQGFSFSAQGGSGAGAGKAEEKKAEKTVFDVKLEKFDAAAKIKIIKIIKELVEKAPVILKQFFGLYTTFLVE
ncbi:large ribosomal subunit protein bL12m-like [Miscanthus floridulus]|uniref:large ribosomal subunit protein bL12m-like n=1 Tax=Miscanthus floridulus TaxID=154761 RepID=UPI003457B527